MSVVVETTIGDITVDLFTEERPIACLNFMKLCKLKYYNYNLFHTVEHGFIAQTGDPTGVGDGGTSVWGVVEGASKRFFEAESVPKIKHTSPGLLSLVSVGKNLVGSQLFFTLGSDLTSLDGIHCVIGEVVEGQETLRKLNEAIVDDKFRPFQDIRITHTVILDDPFPDPRGFRVPSRSPSPTAELMQNGRIGADEDIDDTGGKTIDEIQEMLAEREAKARATILEIVGDLPDADMAPPENVLFVCKLNPVTTDDDLEIIFSRFGKVKNCEVIRDKKSGDSLQYAFVEFEEQKSCEAAFFKMDNVLIDDRRIHVDFSQSVAKVKWRGKGRGVEGQEGKIDFNNLKEAFSRGARDHRPRYETKSRREDGREQITIDERRRAREERHREQERGDRRDRQARSRSRDRVRSGDERRTDRSRREEERRIIQKSSEWECKGRDISSERRRYRRDDSRDWKREQKRPIDERRRYETSSLHRTRNREEHKQSNTNSEKRNDNGVKKTHKRKEVKKSKLKKSRQQSSSDSSSDSDSSSSSSESSSDSSTTTTDSSSCRDKRRRKKSNKSNTKQKTSSSKNSKTKKKKSK